jgi:hypothetical protein
MVRVSSETPITLPELLKLHSKAKLLSLVLDKKKGKRINWQAGTTY